MFLAFGGSTLMSRGTPLAPTGGHSESPSQDHHRLVNQWLEKIINRMTNLPEYYFQDILAEVMHEIVSEMRAAEPDSEAIDHWLNCNKSRARLTCGTTASPSSRPRGKREESG